MLLNNVSKEIYRFTWKRLLLFIGVGRFRILGGGANFQQAHDVVRTSMRRNDVASTSFRRHVPTRFLWNQCQIITFLILKSDIIVDYWGGAKAMLAPPQIIGGPGPPAPPPSSYAYVVQRISSVWYIWRCVGTPSWFARHFYEEKQLLWLPVF